MRRILLFLCCGLPCLAQWTPAQKGWALGTSALLTKVNDLRYDLLAGTEDPHQLAHISDLLTGTWDIHSRAELEQRIVDLALDRNTTAAVAWNYPRAVMLARWGHAAGYFNEDEAWAIIMPAAIVVQRSFSSWQEMGRAYMQGREVFWGQGLSLRREDENVYRTILLDPGSPYASSRRSCAPDKRRPETQPAPCIRSLDERPVGESHRRKRRLQPVPPLSPRSLFSSPSPPSPL